MLLALFRYITVCRSSNSRFTDYIKGKPSVPGVTLIFLAILTPAIIFAASMYFGISATGKMWNFVPIPNSPNSTDIISVMAFQNIDKSKRGSGIIVVTIMSSLLGLQFLLTLFFYASICFNAYKSTINVALKNTYQEEQSITVSDDINEPNAKKESPNDDGSNGSMILEDVEDVDEVKDNQEKKDLDDTDLTNFDGPKEDNIQKNLKTSKEVYSIVKASSSKMNVTGTTKSPNPKKEDPNAIFTICEETIYATDQGTTRYFIPGDSVKLKSVQNKKELSKDSLYNHTMRENSKKKRRKVFLPTANDYKSNIPISGAKLVNVPLTKVVLCLSRHDIVCTASLTSQILCLLITHVLTVVGFRISGQIVSIDAFAASTFAFEIAFLINTMVDPLICIIFSSRYRSAASDLLKEVLNKKETTRRRQ